MITSWRISVLVGAVSLSAFSLGIAARGAVTTIAISGIAALVLSWFVAARITACVERPIRTATNVLDAMRHNDYAQRARSDVTAGPVAELFAETNALANHLAEERFRATEATALFEAVVQRVDVALLAFDGAGLLQWWNPAAERLFDGRVSAGVTADALGVADWLAGSTERPVVLPGHPVSMTWELRRGVFHRDGQRYQFLLLTSLRRVRREEERAAWQRLLRVIGHEVNNTLAPVSSMASTCIAMLRDDGAASIESVVLALGVIEKRSASLAQFIAEYARLARLPEPTLVPVQIGPVLRRIAVMDARCTVDIIGSGQTTILADEALLEQALVNLVRNAVDAAVTTDGKVKIDWKAEGSEALISISDDGPGVDSPENLFVPLFSTKPGGSGIGLVLARNIVEAHGGDVYLVNRAKGAGCIAYVSLPLADRDLVTETAAREETGSAE